MQNRVQTSVAYCRCNVVYYRSGVTAEGGSLGAYVKESSRGAFFGVPDIGACHREAAILARLVPLSQRHVFVPLRAGWPMLVGSAGPVLQLVPKSGQAQWLLDKHPTGIRVKVISASV